MASITDHVIKLQELTQRNLEILQALNDSFFTNQNHLSVRVGDNQYAIPSFISLENKINSLTANFENLVSAPDSGEAFFNFNGNSRSIYVRSYTSVPNSLVLDPVSEFYVEKNDIFKDFLTPNPYVKFNIQSLPNDITTVLVKKIIPISEELKTIFNAALSGNSNVKKSSIRYEYKDLYKILSIYEHDKDYIEYDTKMDLPIRKNIGSGTYVIEDIIEDIVDENLDNFITIKFRTDVNEPGYMSALKYRLFDETIEKMLKIGDQLVTEEGNAKMEIVDLYPNTNTIVVKVLHGEFLNLVKSTSNDPKYISTLSKIRFFSPVNFDEDKYVQVPLEEDQYVFIAIAALNNRMNVQSSWGSGVLIDTYSLLNDKQTFKTYYDKNVKNVGDILFEISSMMSNILTKYTEDEFNEFIKYKPTINLGDLQVVQINTHLNDSDSVKNIRSLYSQKRDLQSQLTETQNEINSLSETLASISFDDTTGRRTAYTAQIVSLNSKKNELNTSISKIINEIAISANNSEVPIENAKYRIRGFFDITNLPWNDHIRGIKVQYRYKNVDNPEANALTFGDRFTFSNWNDMQYVDRVKTPKYENGSYYPEFEQINTNGNEPSFNQIDIPITQGETVDIRVKVIYDYGYPFVQTSSAWSEIVNIEFPDEFLKDVKILDIISENNSDIETNRFNNIIKEQGMPEHLGDKITDQDITYYHKPENIASGFYTAERRIIPLKDKLSDLNNMLIQLQDEVYGTSSDALKVSIKHGSTTTILNPYTTNNIYVEAYSTVTANGSRYEGNYEIDMIPETNESQSNESQSNESQSSKPGIVTTILNLSLYNDSEHIVKLFSMFPGDREIPLNELTHSNKFDRTNYCNTYQKVGVGVHIDTGKNSKPELKLQGGNQYLYFRIKDIHTGEELYKSGDQSNTNNVLSYEKNYTKYSKPENGTNLTGSLMYVYPKLINEYGLCLDSNIIGSYMIIKPKEEIIIPIVVEYYITKEGDSSISKILSFDILPSLYKDAINYTFKITAKFSNSAQDRIIATQQSSYNINDIKYNTIYK